MVRGDGHLAHHPYQRAGRRHGDVHRFRLALIDIEGASPRPRFPAQERGIDRASSSFRWPARRASDLSTRSEHRAAPTSTRSASSSRGPPGPADEWCIGFLAGIFDAEGGAIPRRSPHRNTDPRSSTGYLVPSALRVPVRGRGPATAERHALRPPHWAAFASTCASSSPSIRRSRASARSTDGPEVQRRTSESPRSSRSGWRSTSTTSPPAPATSSRTAWSATTASLAPPTPTSASTPAGTSSARSWSRSTRRSVARAELMKPSWKREHVALGTNTDPYQWVEKKYELLPGVWEAMRDSRHAVLGAHQVAAAAARHRAVQADPRLRRQPLHPHARREGLARQRAAHARTRASGSRRWPSSTGAGIPAGVLVAPLMPGINDSPEQVEEILELCAEAGAVSIGGICLHLRGEVRGSVHGLAALLPARPGAALRGALRPRRLRAAGPERERIARLIRRRGRASHAVHPSRTHAGPERQPEPRSASPQPRRQRACAGLARPEREPRNRQLRPAARLELARLHVALRLARDLLASRAPASRPSPPAAAHLPLAEALELQDLEHHHQVDAGGSATSPNATITSVQPALSVPSSSE